MPTIYETTLWNLLRENQLEGFKFRRQYSIGRYVADFACVAGKLVVELDGRIHDDQQEYDSIRDHFIQELGWKVLRFSNLDLMRHSESVWTTIKSELPVSLPLPGNEN